MQTENLQLKHYFITSTDRILSHDEVLSMTNATEEALSNLVSIADAKYGTKTATFESPSGEFFVLKFFKHSKTKTILVAYETATGNIARFSSKSALAKFVERDLRSVFSDNKISKCADIDASLGKYALIISHIAKYFMFVDIMLDKTSDENIESFVQAYKEINVEAASTTIGTKTAYTDDMRWGIKKSLSGPIYFWKNRDGDDVHIDVEFADTLFFEFSQHGMDLSAATVQFRNNISPKMWNTFKAALELYKTSDIFSPHTRDSLTTAEYRKLVEDKLDNLALHKRSIVADVYQKKILGDAKKNAAVANEKLYNRAIFQEEILEYLTKYDNQKVEIKYTKTILSTGTTRYIIGDLHIGQDIIAKYTLANYNSAVIREMLTEALAEMIEDCSENNELWFMGDIFESITGTMHDGAWKEMEKGKIGAELFKLAHGIMKEFILAIPNLSRVRALGGNHDRMTDSWKGDLFGSVADILFFSLAEQLTNIEILFEPYVMQFQEDGINYILHHGNAKAFGSPKDILSQYGRHDCFNFIIIAHKHHRAIEIDQHNARMIIIPPFTTGNNFSLQAGYSTLPGFMKIKHRLVAGHHALPILTDIPLARR